MNITQTHKYAISYVYAESSFMACSRLGFMCLAVRDLISRSLSSKPVPEGDPLASARLHGA